MSIKYQEFDICIIGAGMVGAACACAFADIGYKVAVVEPFLPEPFDVDQPPDLRVSALNRHSIDLLRKVRALSGIQGMRYRAYSSLSVWEQALTPTTFCAKDVGEEQLGIFAENRVIQLSLLRSIDSHYAQSITLFNDKAEQLDTINGKVLLDGGKAIKATLIVGADGANSQVRKSAGIGESGWDYHQRANLILVNMRESIPDETWQQFTPTGPLALLPMHDNYASLVWYAGPEKSAEIQAMDDVSLKSAIIESFPTRLGNFDVCSKAGFGLTRMHANQYWRNRAVLIGDAAHTINPLAGQGVNLGFKDVAALARAIEKYGIDKLDSALLAYEKERKSKNLLMMSTMDALYATFSNDIKGIKLLRNIALGVAQKAGPLKNMALKYAMGI